MQAKTVLTILLVFVVVWFMVSTIRLNETLVSVRFAVLQPLELELWMVMLASFGVGAGVILFFDIAGGARRFARDQKSKRDRRAREEIEEVYLRGLDSMVNGNYEKALDRFDRVLEKWPDHEGALVKRGDALNMLKRHREAAEALERALALTPENVLALHSLSDVYLDAGADERAKRTLERIIALSPDTAVSARRKLRDLHVRYLRWKEADEIQKQLVNMITAEDELRLEKDTARGIRLGLGIEQSQGGRTSEAIETFRSILSEDDKFVPVYVRLGEALALSSGEDDSAVSEAVRVWRQGYDVTGSTEPLSALQNFYLKDEQPEEAIAIWKQAIVLADNELALRYCLGKLYYRLYMLDDALREFQLIEDRVSGLPALHLYIARILESKNEPSAALAKTKMLVAEVEGLMMDYTCSSCAWRMSEWTERCARCGRWDVVGLYLPADATPEPAIQPAPTWSAY